MPISLEQRLAELKSEYEAGQAALADLEQKKTELVQTMTRIAGAIQVLEEMIEEQNAGPNESPNANA